MVALPAVTATLTYGLVVIDSTGEAMAAGLHHVERDAAIATDLRNLLVSSPDDRPDRLTNARMSVAGVRP